MLIERPPYSKCSSRKMLQICKWRMTVGNVQLHRQVGKNRWENEMRHGMRRRMESDLWNLQRKAALTLKIHLKQSRCIIHTIMTHTHIHRRQTEWHLALLECAHITHTQCLPKSAHDAKDSVQQKKKCKTYRVSRLTHYTFHCAIIPLKAAQRTQRGEWRGGGGRELDRAQLGQFMQVDLADIYEQRAVRQTWTASN